MDILKITINTELYQFHAPKIKTHLVLPVMASDMIRQQLKNISICLTAFNKNRKEVDGNKVTGWIISGEEVFAELFRLGVACRWQYDTLKTLTETKEIIAGVTSDSDWLKTFISVYPDIRIDLELTQPAGVICRTRSGIEVLLRGFANIDTNFDRILKDLEEYGELDEVDRCLKIWRDTGHRPDFLVGDNNSGAPQSHWWWY
ncbi:hypothetical protein KGM_211473 [Danaus plexippus plexippus]|uniref:Uncharacterized protein n=1 Tax=Danaus plexippus plexippus TaxID=278856 RepID=A0A212F0C7_DANPL|nr:hypothetical protein KGM_211473 [Danaus plexippus plexippus]